MDIYLGTVGKHFSFWLQRYSYQEGAYNNAFLVDGISRISPRNCPSRLSNFWSIHVDPLPTWSRQKPNWRQWSFLNFMILFVTLLTFQTSRLGQLFWSNVRQDWELRLEVFAHCILAGNEILGTIPSFDRWSATMGIKPFLGRRTHFISL